MGGYYIDGISRFNRRALSVAYLSIENGYNIYNIEGHKLVAIFTKHKKKVKIIDKEIVLGDSAYAVGTLKVVDKDKIEDANAKEEDLDFVVINRGKKFKYTWVFHFIFALAFLTSRQYKKYICEDEKDESLGYTSGLYGAYLAGKMSKKLFGKQSDAIAMFPGLITPVQLMDSGESVTNKILKGLDGAYKVIFIRAAGKEFGLTELPAEKLEGLNKLPGGDVLTAQIELANLAFDTYANVSDKKVTDKLQYLEFKNSVKRYINKFR